MDNKLNYTEFSDPRLVALYDTLNPFGDDSEWWFKLLSVENGRVRYELHYFFALSGEEIVSVNELAFRSQDDITKALSNAGFEIETIYGDWDESLVSADSPEMIFIAKRV